MSLAKYKAKRNFLSSPEPGAVIKKNTPSLSFVVHRHKASHLHYDFRLELDGVLKSWAVPKGPSMNPKHKRLAIMVEDHPYDYKNFKGTIPSGYGAGIVEIWDKGKYSAIKAGDKKNSEKNLKAALKAGNLKFILKGKKLNGEFALVKLKSQQENAWLLIKHKDAFAVTEAYDSEKETAANSPINKWLTENKTPQKKKFKWNSNPEKKLESFIQPMLAKEVDKPFISNEWLFEIKWDGYRAISEIKDNSAKLYSRNGLSFETAYPTIVKALQQLKHNAVLDGEIVILDEAGKSDFQQLQHYNPNEGKNIGYYVFDLLMLDGKDTCELALTERKKLLQQLVKKNPVIRYSDHVLNNGVDFFALAAAQGLEGIMAKKTDSTYYKGKRTSEWLKIKHHKTTTVIIAGFTQPTGLRKYFGALVLAKKDGRHLKYAGHTGSGFTEALLKKVYHDLFPLITLASPFTEKIKTNMPVTWVKPKFMCEVKFTEWTADGKMRHPVFLGIRKNKSIIVRNMEKPSAKKTAVKKSAAKVADNNSELVFGKIKVTTTNLNKLYWPKKNITKGMMIDYYQTMAAYILPYLKNRPESLKRNPNGILDKGFYHKDAGEQAPEFVQSIPLHSSSANKNIDYIICNNKATLAYLNNLGCIELNPWSSAIQSLDKPDYLIIDIDPSPKNTFEQVIETANAFYKLLNKAGAKSFCKTSGATGLHIFVPMGKKYLYQQVRDFAEILCKIVQEQLPGFTSTARNLKKRGNKIYLDYLQNSRGQTIAAAYSLRPVPGATVSTPLLWKEVKTGLHPGAFDIFTVPQRVKKMKDIFSGVLGKGVDIKKCIEKL